MPRLFTAALVRHDDVLIVTAEPLDDITTQRLVHLLTGKHGHSAVWTGSGSVIKAATALLAQQRNPADNRSRRTDHDTPDDEDEAS